MCGIAGLWRQSNAQSEDGLERLGRRMATTLTHRGPDDAGTFVDAARGLVLAHRRLSIQDLSVAGRQPIASQCERYVLCFNGEIYNHLELRGELGRGHSFRGHSDSETLVTAIAAWGLERTLARCRGMFAFAVWDRERRTLSLARDRLGLKPLYFGWVSRGFVFASELKAVRQDPEFTGQINRAAVALFLRHSYVPAPFCIYSGYFKLPPGCWMTVSDPETPVDYSEYWHALEVAGQSRQRQAMHAARDPRHYLDELQATIDTAVGHRLLADVPLGAFLSGGVDSSLIVSRMCQASSTRVKTFSIGFHEHEWNEARAARQVAEHLGTEHTELYVTPQAAQDVIPELPEIYDEPFADMSQIPTLLVSRLAATRVKVAITGDGGDELFGGYQRYRTLAGIWRRIGWCPPAVRRGVAWGVDRVQPLFSRRWQQRSRLLSQFLGSPHRRAAYHRFHRHWERPFDLVRGAEHVQETLEANGWQLPTDQFQEEMMLIDTVTYLPDDILTKVDRASMAASLEARVPLLDHSVFAKAWECPPQFRSRAGRDKWPLWELLLRDIPRELVDRPKTGFGVPLGEWFRGPLRDWCEDLLAPERLAADGILEPQPVRACWEEHVRGERDWGYYLWDVLMLQAWLGAQANCGP